MVECLRRTIWQNVATALKMSVSLGLLLALSAIHLPHQGMEGIGPMGAAPQGSSSPREPRGLCVHPAEGVSFTNARAKTASPGVGRCCGLESRDFASFTPRLLGAWRCVWHTTGAHQILPGSLWHAGARVHCPEILNDHHDDSAETH